MDGSALDLKSQSGEGIYIPAGRGILMFIDSASIIRPNATMGAGGQEVRLLTYHARALSVDPVDRNNIDSGFLRTAMGQRGWVKSALVVTVRY